MLPVFTSWLDAKLGNRESQNVFQLDLFRREMDAVQPTWTERRHVAGRAASDVKVGMIHAPWANWIPLIRNDFWTIR